MTSEELEVDLQKDDIICKVNDNNSDLYIILEGELIVCSLKGSEITPLAYLGAGEYLGELSFFDHGPRSAYVIATKKSKLLKIPVNNLPGQMPSWLYTTAKQLTMKLRKIDELIREKGIRKKNVETVRPLDIKDQSHYFQLIKNS